MTTTAVYVTTATAAQMLSLHPETLRIWHRNGLYNFPKPVRIGGRFRWNVTELKEWASSQQRDELATP
ncbi:helix-turn-helix domain protein [Mycobacteroides abscessus subsp. bolletii]|nr:helix-turn-helix domain protein [Mycobacteroides abscessus subsp. bolletii]SKS28000.1 helix-turn-helix domain protein [Mycobacteroides abscessus subsp. abscessus]SHW63834.1 helix-turn-helix domain protein [Mycobacteroides abscessus subsp. bolletii]SHW91893.1 helix-turn-helix domain protein [Mycobacteroides abscessus subsp. bolletii]SHX33092.1 helix-turn-helix domain protein [Mycobacteroides abscessus subsp. bolletii]